MVPIQLLCADVESIEWRSLCEPSQHVALIRQPWSLPWWLTFCGFLPSIVASTIYAKSMAWYRSLRL